ncbi:aromatic-ring-hydroxylating dioxygenase subunit beta [Burkholderia multivorans]|uniref:aromatic-ring-hydroxylating dioxygenase subunit beta n=1 Tax=Burkholderia multivorans TaxID=87883 RepID=UPI000D002475|nr:aromatic-ring-hydroxylating dioxygenase subunit beta [Burkholderia multivorans]PRF73233.1 aromatic-ring-hydroxylating dioxygenase subunit beta [Burkholderia multivorans]
MNEIIPVSGNERAEVESTLYREARLLENEDYREWLKMIHREVEYKAFNQQLRFRKEKRYNLPDKVYSLDENYHFLEARIQQFESGSQWTADPPERIRRFLTNVEVYKTSNDENYHVYLNVFTVRNRRVYDETTFSYGREEEWTRDGEQLKLLKRVVNIDERFIHGKNLNFFM